MPELSYSRGHFSPTVTTWVENPRGGRARGPRGLARAWVEVMIRPRRFFSTGVAPGDQAAGLAFGVLVTLVSLAADVALGARAVPAFTESRALSTLLLFALVGIFVAPAVLHLVAALQTLVLVVLVRDRAGVSETVQVLAYAVAPAVFAGGGADVLALGATLYGSVLLAVGLAVVHETDLVRGSLAAAPAAALVFGYGFGGFAALTALL